jgi:hypothetical protein
MPSESVVFQGVTYNRYPESKRISDRRYFKRFRGYLHRDVWSASFGAIPKGGFIHHKDGNTVNNDISNLELVTPKQHADCHASPERKERGRQRMADIRPLASAWHASAEGRAWHREHARKVASGLLFVDKKCTVCDAAYSVKSVAAKRSKHCSNSCKSKARRLRGDDDEFRICPVCGECFRCNRYAKTKRCSLACANRARFGPSDGVQPVG